MQYTFNISLSVLNHLGRNLYRSFITVIGEAISNSWDADAKNVWIEIDRDARSMYIVDDGIGMTSSDFQGKFLKIGYSKRVNNESTSLKGRPYIGRKGIGKLALLSCAKKIHIASKADGLEVVGGTIDNTGLDQAIADDISAQDYPLEQFSELVGEKLETLESGTALFFQDITDGIYNTIEYLRKAIAINFRFSLIDSDFNIILNGKSVTVDDLSVLAGATQFVWEINEADDPYLSRMVSPNTNPSVKSFEKIDSNMQISGFVATTLKPSDLNIPGSNDRVSLDLFVNGRLREKDLLKHIHSARIVENYLYGQIHYNALDNEKDIFTSSREGVLSDDPTFRELLQELKNIVSEIIEKWDVLREAKGGDGDPDNPRRTPKQRKAIELFTATVDEILPTGSVPSHGIVEEWVGELKDEAQFNIPSYTECFVAENLLRQHILHNNVTPTTESIREANRWRKKEQDSTTKANINYSVRQVQEDVQYLSMDDLANLVDKPSCPEKERGIARDAIIYKPLRDAVAHTSLLTENAKKHLSIIFSNIQARLNQLLTKNTPKT